MKKTTGGYRAAQFETIIAADRGDYADKSLYVVEGLPGVWRRAKAPKVDPAAVGLLACWYDGGIIYLEHCVSVNDELKHAEGGDAEAATFLEILHSRREEAMMKDRGDKEDTEPAAVESGQDNGAETAQSEPAGNSSAPNLDVDV